VKSQLGWTHVSRKAVQQAEAQLASESQGVVDELGMLEIHQGYADRFFPGTSVLHTRLRYVLFVAWAYESLRHHRTVPRDIGSAIAAQEQALGNALKRNTDSWGLIGRRVLPKMPAQRPSMMYWSAVGAWGLLHRHPDGSSPSRAEVHSRLAKPDSHVELLDDEGRPLLREASPFIQLPPIPKGWPESPGIDFSLTGEEQHFLRDCLGRVHQPGAGKLSLMARLANRKAGLRLKDGEPFLCEEIQKVAGDDWTALVRADQAAGLAAITRGIYLALVEWLGIQDGLGERTRSLENLNSLVICHRQQALKLNLVELSQDVRFRARSGVPQLLRAVQDWLKQHEHVKNHGVLFPLLQACLDQEKNLKGVRARLGPRSHALRREWWHDKARNNEEPPEPLHYRWYVTVNLLRDLENRG
jgi:hypothetical protein